VKKWAKELYTAFSNKEVQIAEKHNKKCSPSLAIKKCKSKPF
jgi:hypothetical protein